MNIVGIVGRFPFKGQADFIAAAKSADGLARDLKVAAKVRGQDPDQIVWGFLESPQYGKSFVVERIAA